MLRTKMDFGDGPDAELVGMKDWALMPRPMWTSARPVRYPML